MNRKRIIILVVFVIGLLLYSPVSAESKFSKQEIGKFIQQVLTEWKVPGMAVGVIQDGKVVLAEGYGYRDVEKKLPVTPQTLFAIGSSTKAFTAFIMGTLVDEGKVDWNTPVKTYLPDFKMNDPYVTENMTPRDLLIHDSGLPRHDTLWYGSERTMDDIFKSLQYLEPSKGFRSAFQYQNLMYMTAGYLEGKIAKSSWQELAQKRILDPLGMKDTNFSVEISQKCADYALPYNEEEDKAVQMPFYSKMAAIAPAGAINSNVNDMLQWVKLHLQDGKWGDKPLIKDTTLQYIHFPQMVVPGDGFVGMILKNFEELSFMNYGMGWFIQFFRGHMILHHGGNIDGFSAFVTFMPETKSGIVVLTNKNTTLSTLAVSFYIYDRLLGVKPRQWDKEMKSFSDKLIAMQNKMDEGDKSRKENTVSSHPLQDYASDYVSPAYGSLSIIVKDNALQLKYNAFSSPLKHYHYDIFEIEKGLAKGLKLQFSLNEKGDIGNVSIPLEPAVSTIVFNRAPEDKLKSPEFLKKFVGRYEFEANKMQAQIGLRGENTLILTVPGQPQYELVPYKDVTFNLKELNGFTVEFIMDKEGNVTGLISHQPNGNFTVKRVSDK